MMDKSCNSSAPSTVSSCNRDHYLKQLNKISHKISKPPVTTANSAASVKLSVFDPDTTIHHQAPPPATAVAHSNQGNPLQNQPPVYNINKNDFRDVVQRLTGSPAYERVSTPPPPPTHQPKPQSSRLQRIRPPPLAHVSNRPPSLLNDAALPAHHSLNPNPNPDANPEIPMTVAANTTSAGFIPRPMAPLSPLPPLPPVHAVAESPVSAYMRYLKNSMSAVDSNGKQSSGFSPLAPLVSPRWYQQQENAPPQHNILPPPPPPPAGSTQLGCLSSPKSPYGLISPSIYLSSTSCQLGFPHSPTSVPVPVTSPFTGSKRFRFGVGPQSCD